MALLGYIVGADSIRVDTLKIEAVKKWPRPMTPTEVRNFLGLTSYYRISVEKFASISALLSRLTQKGVKFQWTRACQRTFQLLKEKLTTSPVLTLPDGPDRYVIYCDASGKANVIADALSKSYIGSTTHIEEGKKSGDFLQRWRWCVEVKVKHQRSYGLAQNIEILE
ncbi:uncharacterized mitochondrial protein AtMg00860-like [Solanum dulcamara]|uniref:uncharacterized mitochondrial protein AtMg00860-like n=1 Tax=Solanum dulcamara TaxID=45834 RepID=UPI002486BF44|nr:uncharacterized mitochondrial protein AtMg00860-like [Solanum dulcamara]